MTKRPNILLLTTDQQRYDTIAALGYPYMITPNLDRLVREGCSFPLAYSPNPACIPARHSLITGLYSRDHGLDDNYFDGARLMPRGLPTLAGVLSDSGYDTIAVGKMHFQPARNHNGFGKMELMEEMPRWREDDEYAAFLRDAGHGELASLHGVRNLLYMLPQNPLQPEELCVTPWVADRVIHHIRENAGRRPFFLWGSWIAPHPPLSVPKRYADLYRGCTLPEAIPPDEHPKPVTLQNSRIGDYTTPELARRGREYYYGAITWVDEQVGRILAALEETGQLDDTLILFTSDHGELLGDHGSYQKFQHYEGSSRVPLIMRFPRAHKPGTVRENFTDLCDLMPTILDAAGVAYPGEGALPGGSLLHPDEGRDRTVQYVEHNHGGARWVSLRDVRYKYVYFYGGGQEELFDLERDPQERENLADAPALAGVKKRLREGLLEKELQWGPSGCVADGDFIPYPPIERAPRLPASFPVFPKNLPPDEKVLALEEEILSAIADEPATRLAELSWRDWVAQGYFPEEQMNRLLQADAQRKAQEAGR